MADEIDGLGFNGDPPPILCPLTRNPSRTQGSKLRSPALRN
jgi:hypothetical protein